MRGALARSLAAASLAAALAGSGPALAGDGPTRLQVRGTEWDLTLSRAKVDPGRARIEFVNEGEDAHDLKLRRLGAARKFAVGEVEPGAVAEFEPLRLRRASRYRLWCSLEEGLHRELGMEATLRVRRRG
jgi:plastocyanin